MSTVWGWTEEAATGVAVWSELKALVCCKRNSGRPFWFIFGSSLVSSDLHTNPEGNLPINHDNTHKCSNRFTGKPNKEVVGEAPSKVRKTSNVKEGKTRLSGRTLLVGQFFCVLALQGREIVQKF